MKINSNSEPKHGKLKQNAKQNKNSPSDTSPQLACWNKGRFYGGGDDDDAFWRLSFSGERNIEHKKSEDIVKNPVVMHNLDAERHGRKEGTVKDIGLREERKLLNETKELECLRRRYERKAQRVLQEQILKLENAAEEAEFASSKCKSLEKDELQFELPRTICTPRTHLFSSYVDARCSGLGIGSIKEAGVSSAKQREELKAKVNKKRQSVYVSRELPRRKPKHSSKVRAHSPRMTSKVEICKIKAIEDKRKAKLKMKKEEGIVEETAGGLDSFAVVKCSLDPQQDFRDSMIEMIREKQISQPEEMEELLACYLTLNSNEYHDLIIKAFRQVWLHMSQASLGTKSDKQCCRYD